MAAGNGGQIAMAIPELDIVRGFWGGSYNDAGSSTWNQYIPKYVLPAIEKFRR